MSVSRSNLPQEVRVTSSTPELQTSYSPLVALLPHPHVKQCTRALHDMIRKTYTRGRGSGKASGVLGYE
jgi:hypothetical protein